MMNKLNKLTLAVATTAALGAAAPSSVYAGMTLQGPLRSGIALQSLESNQPIVTVVTLPSGESVDLRQQGPTQAIRK
jgi:hypothetical protein